VARCALDLTDPRFEIEGDASDSALQAGLTELQAKLAKDHRLSGFFSQPMQGFPDYQKRVWKWDFAPSGEGSSTRKGWRLLAYVPDPHAPEPIPARAFLCYDKDEEPKGNPAKNFANRLKKFLSKVIDVQATPERFRRQELADGRIVSMCHGCFETIFSPSHEEADLVESAHECQSK
jgi:hypothetical protein